MLLILQFKLNPVESKYFVRKVESLLIWTTKLLMCMLMLFQTHSMLMFFQTQKIDGILGFHVGEKYFYTYHFWLIYIITYSRKMIHTS